MIAARLAQVGLTLALVLVLAGSSAGAAPPRSRNVYVANNADTVSQYDVDSQGYLNPKTPATVSAGHLPSYGIAMTPDGASLYATAAGSNIVSQYDVAANGALSPKVTPATATGATPFGIAVSPGGTSAYVADIDGNVVSEYDVLPNGSLTPKPTATIAAGLGPAGVAIAPDGKSAYVTNLDGDTISQYDIGAAGVLTPKSTPAVPTADGPWGVIVSPDGRGVYVTNSGGVSQYDVDSGGALVPKTPAFVASTTPNPIGLAITPDGHSVYVAEAATPAFGQHGDLRAFDVGAGGTLSPKPTPVYPIFGDRAYGVSVTPDGKNLYVSTDKNRLWEFTIEAGGALTSKRTGTRLDTTPTGTDPVNLVARPDAGPLAAFTVPPVRAGSQARFFAGGSTDADGTIASYDWDFGDGMTGAGLQALHTFAAPGVYTVTLRVTDDTGCSSTLVFTGQTAYCPADPAAVTTQSITVRPPLPALRGLRLSPVAFRALKGTTISYRDLRAATTVFTVSRTQRGYRSRGRCLARRPAHSAGRCTRATALKGRFTHRDRAGSNRFHFNARLRGKALSPGTYLLHALPRAGADVGQRITTAFRIRP